MPLIPPIKTVSDKEQKRKWNVAAEQLAQTYDLEASIRLPLVWNRPQNESGRYIFDFSVVALSLELPVNSIILDVAAGSCWVSEWLQQLGYRTVSFDVSLAQLQYGKKRFASNSRIYPDFKYYFVCADGEQLPFKNETFDGIVCLNSFHHMPDYQPVLKELYRILRPAGKAVFSEPGALHAQTELAQREIQESGVVEKNVELDELFQLAKSVGFKKMVVKPVVYPDSIGYELGQWKQLESMQPELVTQFMTHLTTTVRNLHPIFILNKSDIPKYDSRYPNVLHAQITLLKIPTQVRSGDPFKLVARIKNIGDTVWLHESSPFGGYVTFLVLSLV